MQHRLKAASRTWPDFLQSMDLTDAFCYVPSSRCLRSWDLARVCFWWRDGSKLILSKNAISVSYCNEEIWRCVSDIYLGDSIMLGHNACPRSLRPPRMNRLSPVSWRGGAVAKPTWHRYRKYIFSESSLMWPVTLLLPFSRPHIPSFSLSNSVQIFNASLICF